LNDLEIAIKALYEKPSIPGTPDFDDFFRNRTTGRRKNATRHFETIPDPRQENAFGTNKEAQGI
jgi:hypothetical protein